jgi:prevent-host-death family protein
MATDVPQRQLRNDTAALLRRVEAGERLRVTVHGHPVAELVPAGRAPRFLPRDALVGALGGLLDAADPLERVLREGDDRPLDPFG